MSAHTKRNKSKDEPRDAKFPSTDTISQVYYLWRADGSLGNRAEKTTQAWLAPEAYNSTDTNTLRHWGFRMIEARWLPP